MSAHIGGVPVEEALLPWVTWTGAALLVASSALGAAGRWISGLRRISVHEAEVPPTNDQKGRSR